MRTTKKQTPKIRSAFTNVSFLRTTRIVKIKNNIPKKGKRNIKKVFSTLFDLYEV
jgi:hypothetical protein